MGSNTSSVAVAIQCESAAMNVVALTILPPESYRIFLFIKESTQ